MIRPWPARPKLYLALRAMPSSSAPLTSTDSCSALHSFVPVREKPAYAGRHGTRSMTAESGFERATCGASP